MLQITDDELKCYGRNDNGKLGTDYFLWTASSTKGCVKSVDFKAHFSPWSNEIMCRPWVQTRGID